jgi:hypothetical protein
LKENFIGVAFFVLDQAIEIIQMTANNRGWRWERRI